MIELIGTLQQAVLGTLLLWAGLFKTVSRGSAEAANASALPLVLRRPALATPVYRVVGGLETTVALLLLLPPAAAWEMATAAALTGLFLGYLGYSRRVAPDLPCGCLGGGHTAVSRRTLLRAALLCAASLLGLAGGGYWLTDVIRRPGAAAAVLTLQGLALLALCCVGIGRGGSCGRCGATAAGLTAERVTCLSRPACARSRTASPTSDSRACSPAACRRTGRTAAGASCRIRPGTRRRPRPWCSPFLSSTGQAGCAQRSPTLTRTSSSSRWKRRDRLSVRPPGRRKPR